MDLDGVLALLGRSHQRQLASLGRLGHGFLLIAGGNAAHVRFDPDLQEMRLLAFGVVELAVAHAAAGAHALHISGRDALDVAHAVLVGQIAREHVADDLHVTVAVRAKTGTRGDAVFVDHAQVAPTHVLRVKVLGERKAVKALEPAMVGQAPVFGFAEGQHDGTPVGRWKKCRASPAFDHAVALLASFNLIE